MRAKSVSASAISKPNTNAKAHTNAKANAPRWTSPLPSTQR